MPELMAAISPAEWAQVPGSILEVIYELVHRSNRVEQEIAELRTENELLKEQLARTSANSSQPPSKNPQGFKPNRKDTGKKRGGRTFRTFGTRTEAIPDPNVQEVINHYPQQCNECRTCSRLKIMVKHIDIK